MDKTVKFGVISDVQYSELETYDTEKRPSQLGLKKLSDAIETLNKSNLDFMINLGDLIDRDSKFFEPALQVLGSSRAPVWHVLGNHDFCGLDYDYGHTSEALTALNMTEQSRYYYKDIGSWRFIVLDTNELGVIEPAPGSAQLEVGQQYLDQLKAKGNLNALVWNGGVSDAQLGWLKQTIANAQNCSLSVIVFGHGPIYPASSLSLLNAQQVAELLSKRASVKAYINGHDHDGSYAEFNGLPCWTIEGMMDFKDKTAYAHVELQPRKMTINGYGRVASRILSLR